MRVLHARPFPRVWAQGILAREQIFGSQYGNQTLAHELGQFLVTLEMGTV